METRINEHNFEFYESIDSLPITQFHAYSKYVLVSSGIGDGIESIDTHINKIASYIQTDPKRAIRELLNYRKNLYSIVSGSDYKNKAILCLVKKVDGNKWEDFSDSGINRLYEMVTTATEREMRDISDRLRKRLDDELMEYFPEVFDSSIEKNYTELLRKRAFLQLSQIIDKVDHRNAIEDLTSEIMALFDTRNFDGKESAEIQFDKQFEEMCLVISKEFGGMVKNYTVMEFYTAYKMLQEQQRQLKNLKK